MNYLHSIRIIKKVYLIILNIKHIPDKSVRANYYLMVFVPEVGNSFHH